MQSSQLIKIIQRLEAMRNDHIRPNIRYFDVDGSARCQVEYFREYHLFVLYDYVHEQVFEFDDIDLVAIEIYELIQ